MRGAEAIDKYEAMDPQEAFDIEYWSLEDAKLRRLPLEKELEGQIVVIIGAGSGIGKATAHRLAREGAHVVCADLNETAAKETARAIVSKHGEGIGVAGTGISNCGPAIALLCEVTDRSRIALMFENAILAYGGVDSVIVTAGVFFGSDDAGKIDRSAPQLAKQPPADGGAIVPALCASARRDFRVAVFEVHVPDPIRVSVDGVDRIAAAVREVSRVEA